MILMGEKNTGEILDMQHAGPYQHYLVGRCKPRVSRDCTHFALSSHRYMRAMFSGQQSVLVSTISSWYLINSRKRKKEKRKI